MASGHDKRLKRGGVTIGQNTLKALFESEHISPGMLKAIKDLLLDVTRDPPAKDYYRIQSNQELGNKQFTVSVYFVGLDEGWISPLENAIRAINEAAPGLHLHQVEHEPSAKIIVEGNEKDGCRTRGNIISSQHVNISLQKNWPVKRRGGTAIHEIMHALGFLHEHQRREGEKFFIYDPSIVPENRKNQYAAVEYVIGLSRFDPHSIMMYSLCKALQRKPEGDTVWLTKPGDERCQVLSELDKVCLNIMYGPVEHEGYKPRSSSSHSKTGLMYCNRTYCGHDDGTGRKQGPNCPACRVLKTRKSEQIKDLGKWQGWTGLVYCGKEKGQGEGEGLCGPDQGEPCMECARLIGYTGNF